MLDKAFEGLQSYDWGSDQAAIKPIDDAIVASAGDSATRSEIEKQLIAVLQSDASRDAKDVVCRRLRRIGTATCTQPLADYLADKELSHMARYALEQIPDPAAADVLRDSLTKLNGELLIGVIGSLGVRQDEKSVALIAERLADSDPAVARAAALALGNIQSVAAAKAISAAKPTDEAVKIAAADAALQCAEAMLASGKKGEAMKLYKGLLSKSPSKQVKLAVTRGMLACAAQK